MSGLGKRTAEYVPEPARLRLDKLSKATLMELLWDFALRNGGGAEAAYDEILAAHTSLQYAGMGGQVYLQANPYEALTEEAQS